MLNLFREAKRDVYFLGSHNKNYRALEITSSSRAPFRFGMTGTALHFT